MAKEPRGRIACLRLGCHGPDLQEAETHRGQCRHSDAVLVEAGRQPDRVGEMPTPNLLSQSRIDEPMLTLETAQSGGELLEPLQSGHRRTVGGFGPHSQQQTVKG
jgi:hypothetical protein